LPKHRGRIEETGAKALTTRLTCADFALGGTIFGDIDLLDEGYYTYFDDIDFCFNAQSKISSNQ